jgi:hypothetical protein
MRLIFYLRTPIAYMCICLFLQLLLNTCGVWLFIDKSWLACCWFLTNTMQRRIDYHQKRWRRICSFFPPMISKGLQPWLILSTKMYTIYRWIKWSSVVRINRKKKNFFHKILKMYNPPRPLFRPRSICTAFQQNFFEQAQDVLILRTNINITFTVFCKNTNINKALSPSPTQGYFSLKVLLSC